MRWNAGFYAAADFGTLPPVAENFLPALANVERLARNGAVPAPVLARLLRVITVVRSALPRLATSEQGGAQAYTVIATATDYLPVAIGNYLRLPREWADHRPVRDGKSSLMLLVDQLDQLAVAMDHVNDALIQADAQAMVAHGIFLKDRFGPNSPELQLTSPAQGRV